MCSLSKSVRSDVSPLRSRWLRSISERNVRRERCGLGASLRLGAFNVPRQQTRGVGPKLPKRLC
jgi:hypothetical protein